MTSTVYADDHASAVAAIAAAGVPVTFSRVGLLVYDATSDNSYPAAPTLIAGYAVRVKGNPLKYQALSLVQSEAPALLFAPSVLGGLPLPGDTVTWAGADYTARDVEPEAPDGVAIGATVIVAR